PAAAVLRLAGGCFREKQAKYLVNEPGIAEGGFEDGLDHLRGGQQPLWPKDVFLDLPPPEPGSRGGGPDRGRLPDPLRPAGVGEVRCEASLVCVWWDAAAAGGASEDLDPRPVWWDACALVTTTPEHPELIGARRSGELASQQCLADPCISRDQEEASFSRGSV